MPSKERSPFARCTACDQKLARPDPFFYIWRGRRFSIYRCAKCTHQFVQPSITPDEQLLMYGDQYFSKEGDWVCGIFQASYVDAQRQLRAEAREILSLLPAPPGRLLDIGCAGGVFLDEARRRGFEVAGIELNASMAQYARDTYGVEVRTGRIEDVPDHQWSGAFSVVTLLDCLEHVPEPLAAMRKVGQWVRPGGCVFVRGPLSNSLVSHLKEAARRLVWLQKQLPGYPLDANIFTKRSLGTLLALSGFGRPSWIREGAGFSNLLARREGAPLP